MGNLGETIIAVPTPGSDKALELGCRCPVLDNAHGKGFPWGDTNPAFWIAEDCPLHGAHSAKDA